ncbi:MAG: phenylalanine--tRNA ligase subunit beta [Candidatus Hydrogenedentes bacterium]|nr:phenylalanine--tRNA ligase subunit beta [Candidatus Hydrogenedentota bacterium]
MRVSLNWLKEFIDLPVGPDELAERMTMAGLVIESIERPNSDIQNVVVGHILSIEPHPGADKLVVCRTDVGESTPLQIICGASNMKVGDKVPTAREGSALPGGVMIGRRKMRGVESQGMMCSARELGMGEDQQGLLILDPAFPIGKDIIPLLGLDDTIINFEITPNRGDWAGMIGLARELSAIFETPYRFPTPELVEEGPPVADLSSVTIEAPELCPRYVGRVITGLKIESSPAWLARRLHASGMRPISNLVDITNYVLIETGHPLHAFDLSKLIEKRVVVRIAKHGETLRTIDEQSRNLTSDMLVIADGRNPVAIAGIMGGKESEVGPTTTEVFLESAYFDRKSIRRTARELNMQTEASARFQRGADHEMARLAIDRATALMQQIAGGRVARGVLDAHPKPRSQPPVKLRFARTDLLLGTRIRRETQQDKLEKLGFRVTSSNSDDCTLEIPSWRHDVTCEADLIEEVARLYGYENVETSLPTVRRGEEEFAPFDRRLAEFRHYLASLGLTEITNMSFSNPRAVQKARLNATLLDMIALLNPLSEDHATLRTTLIPGLLETASLNFRHGAQGVSFFEIGPVFLPGTGRELPDEQLRVGLVLAGKGGEKHWSRPAQTFDFYDLKGFAEAILDCFGVKYSFRPSSTAVFEPGHGADVHFEDTPIGYLGKVCPDVQRLLDILPDLYILELHLPELLTHERDITRFQPIPNFPASVQDLALLIDARIPAGALVDTTRAAGGNLLKKVRIFDQYLGEQVPIGRKSIALSLTFQASDRTLTDAEADALRDKILHELRVKHGAEQR